MDLYLYCADEQIGPYTEVQARAMVASNQITRTCLAWHEGLDEWLPLEQVITLPKPPKPPPTTKGLPPIPPRTLVRPRQTAVPASTPTSSTIRTVSGIIALLLGLLAIFNVGGCMHARAKLSSFQRGDNAMDGVDMLVDTARGMNEGDPLRGVSGLLGKAHSLQDDYEGYQVGAWLCVVGTAAAGLVYRFCAPAKTA